MYSKSQQKMLLAVTGDKDVKAFQKSQKITADGIWGANTNAKAVAYIKKVQAYLVFSGSEITSDGIIGNQTNEAIKAFKVKHGLPNSVTIGEKTEAALFQLPSGYVAPHFKKTEFMCECGKRWCNGYNGKSVDPALAAILERLRRHFGKPITITSGIRCQRYNDSLRGSIPNSVHRLGGAADIYIPGITSTSSGRAKVRKLAYQYGAKYCYYGTSNMGNAVHINV